MGELEESVRGMYFLKGTLDLNRYKMSMLKLMYAAAIALLYAQSIRNSLCLDPTKITPAQG